MNKVNSGFQYIRQKFPNITEAKIKEGIFVGPQIKQLMMDPAFDESLDPVEIKAWTSFKLVCLNFLGNNRASNYVDIVEAILQAYEEINVHMSLKIHFMHSHLNEFASNQGAVSDEHGGKEFSHIACRLLLVPCTRGLHHL